MTLDDLLRLINTTEAPPSPGNVTAAFRASEPEPEVDDAETYGGAKLKRKPMGSSISDAANQYGKAEREREERLRQLHELMVRQAMQQQSGQSAPTNLFGSGGLFNTRGLVG